MKLAHRSQVVDNWIMPHVMLGDVLRSRHSSSLHELIGWTEVNLPSHLRREAEDWECSELGVFCLSAATQPYLSSEISSARSAPVRTNTAIVDDQNEMDDILRNMERASHFDPFGESICNIRVGEVWRWLAARHLENVSLFGPKVERSSLRHVLVHFSAFLVWGGEAGFCWCFLGFV